MDVQDLATQWLQSYPCKTKTSQETQKSLMKFLEPTRKPKVIYTDNSLEFGKSCEDLSWNHCTSNAAQIRNTWDCRKNSAQSERKGHLLCYCSPVWFINGARIPWNVAATCETCKISYLMGRHHTATQIRNNWSRRSGHQVGADGRI